MPFDLARLMPAITQLATYYADELAPDLLASSTQAWALIQQAHEEELRQAAQQHTLRVLALPLEDPARAFPAPPPIQTYRVLASDGSAMDPNPHLPARYLLLHCALAGLAYAPPAYWTDHATHLLFRRDELEVAYPGTGGPVAVEGPVVATLRAYEELRLLWEGAQQLPADPHGRPLLAMMDGIILWTHRGTGPGHDALKEDYLTRSVALLEEFRRALIPLVSFTSMPHHSEVVSTLLARFCTSAGRLACAECRAPGNPCQALLGLEDRNLFGFLPEGARSATFQPIYQGETRWRLPGAVLGQDPSLVFFYVNTGEIARVELPLWIQEAGLLDLVHGIVVDQCRARRAETPGFPVALDLAHHEAVLTPRDRGAIQMLVEEALARRLIFAAPSAKARAKER